MKKYLSTRYSDGSWSFGLLILRLASGGLMLIHGYDKLSHYATYKGMNTLFGTPIDIILVIFAEFFCAALLVMGLFTRFAAIPLIITMGVAFFKAHEGKVTGQNSGEMALLYLCCFATLLFTGPGKFSADAAISK